MIFKYHRLRYSIRIRKSEITRRDDVDGNVDDVENGYDDDDGNGQRTSLASCRSMIYGVNPLFRRSLMVSFVSAVLLPALPSQISQIC